MTCDSGKPRNGAKGLANGRATAAFVLRIEPLRVSTKGFNRLSQGEEK